MGRMILDTIYEGATTNLQYIGNPFDIVHVSASISLGGSFPIKDITVGTFNQFVVSSVKDKTPNTIINAAPINTPRTYVANKHGLYNIVLNTQNLPINTVVNIESRTTEVS